MNYGIYCIYKIAKKHAEFKNYKKGYLSPPQIELLKKNLAKAIARAKKLKSPTNPSTNFYDLFELFDKLKTQMQDK